MDEKSLKIFLENFINEGKIIIKGKSYKNKINIIKDDLEHIQKDGDTLNEKLYLFYYNKIKPKCPKCGNYIKFHNFSNPYQKYCSIACSREEAVKNSKKTNLERYGVEYTFQSKDIKNKIKETNLKRYGSENPWGSNMIQKKIKKTNLERYGVENPNQSKKILNKSKQTKKTKYGNENYNNSKLRKKTNLKRYGSENGILDNQEEKQSAMKNKYGVKNAYQLDWVKEKIIKKRIANNNLGKNHKFIEYKGKKLQSRFELKTAEILESKNIVWESHNKYICYEIDNIKKRYNPDFYLPEYNIYLEPHTSYYWDEKFLNKMNAVNKLGFVTFYFQECEINLLLEYLDNLCKNSHKCILPI